MDWRGSDQFAPVSSLRRHQHNKAYLIRI